MFGAYQFQDDFRTNLADEEKNRYAIIKIALGYGTLEGGYVRYYRSVIEPEFKRYENQMRDIIISTLSSKRAVDLENFEGRMAFKRELIIKLNDLLTGGRFEYVNEIYYEYINIL